MAVQVSIVIPIYNAERYLEKCITTILQLSFKSYELILVNDGSKDNSLKICEKYAQQDKRVRILNQDNKGVSAARNSGMSVAEGDFIVFIDADDTISPRIMDGILSDVVSIDADICFWGYRIIGNGIERVVETGRYFGERKSEILYQLVTKNLFGIACNKAIRSSLVRRKKLSFPVERKVFEDQQFMMRVWEYSDTVACLEAAPYNYIQHEESAYSSFSRKKLDEYIALHNDNMQCLTSFLRNNGIGEREIDSYRYSYAKSEIGNTLRLIYTHRREEYADSLFQIKNSELCSAYLKGYRDFHKGVKEKVFYYALISKNSIWLQLLALYANRMMRRN